MSTRVTIPAGGDTEPVVPIFINTADLSQRVGVTFTATPAMLAVLQQSNLAGEIMVNEVVIEPLIFMDFKNAVYTVEGDPVALATLLAEDVEFGNYDPVTDVVAGVGLTNGTSPVLTGDALDLIVAGSTILCTFELTVDSADSNFDIELVDSSSYNTYYYANFDAYSGVGGGGFIGDGDTDVDYNELSVGRHACALTFVDGRIAMAIDGGNVVEIDPALAWSPVPAAFHLAVGGAVIVESVGIYPVQNDIELPGLSEI